MKIAIFGLGLIGKQRLRACLDFGIQPSQIHCIDPHFDSNFINLNSWATGVNFSTQTDGFLLKSISHAIVAVPHAEAPVLVQELLNCGIEVLMEKPLGRNLEEAIKLAEHPHSSRLSIGFNYRFMPAIEELRDVVAHGSLGELTNIRIDLGHGGAPKDKDSWKLDPILAGGGVALDPGIHALDLLQFIFGANPGNIKISGATTWKGFWNTGIEESINVVGYLKDIPFNLTISIVAWKTRFNIEVIGSEGYIQISGRGRTDGPQKITIGKKWGWMSGQSQVDSEDTRIVAERDSSLNIETNAWLHNLPFVCSPNEAVIGMNIYEKVLEAIEK